MYLFSTTWNFIYGNRTMGRIRKKPAKGIKISVFVLPVLMVLCSVLCSAQEPLPARYSLAEEGKKPKVRSQGNTGTCWAISAVSAMESDLLPQTRIELSPDHMSLSSGFNITQEDGGDYYMIMSYLSDWKGPVLEAEDPYGDGVSPEGLNAALHVQEMRMLQTLTREEAKRAILEYGALQSSLCLDRERTDTEGFYYYNPVQCAYYDPLVENLDHDILILGWDDTFSRDHFLIRPSVDGAWICQNTWGESFGEDGIFYVSYEDRNLLRKGGMVYNRIESADNYDRVYENDSLGWQGRQGYGEEGCWFSGAFTAQEDGQLAAAGLYSTGPGTVCSVYVIPRFSGEEDLKSVAALNGDPSGSPAAEARMDTAGYYTIDLDRPTELSAGQDFAVVVWIRTEGEERPVAVEMIKDSYTAPVSFEGRRTWISKDGKDWERTQTVYHTNLCLKAYTKDPAEDSTENPAEDSVENPAEKPAGTPAGNPTEDPAKNPAEDSAETPALQD